MRKTSQAAAGIFINKKNRENICMQWYHLSGPVVFTEIQLKQMLDMSWILIYLAGNLFLQLGLCHFTSIDLDFKKNISFTAPAEPFLNWNSAQIQVRVSNPKSFLVYDFKIIIGFVLELLWVVGFYTNFFDGRPYLFFIVRVFVPLN
jgi:hypothetical protein